MTVMIYNTGALAMCNAIVDLIDGGAGAGTIAIRTGSAPANCETADSGTLLATLTFSDPAFGNAADIAPGARATASAITADSSIDATNTAAHFRIYDSNSVCIIQGAVGTSGSDINFNSVAFVSGAECQITALTVTVPES
jgi:hypothetical protein